MAKKTRSVTDEWWHLNDRLKQREAAVERDKELRKITRAALKNARKLKRKRREAAEAILKNPEYELIKKDKVDQASS